MNNFEQMTYEHVRALKAEITARFNATVTVCEAGSSSKLLPTHEEERTNFLAIFVDLNEKTSIIIMILSLFSWRKTSVLIKYAAKLDGYSDLNMLNISL